MLVIGEKLISSSKHKRIYSMEVLRGHFLSIWFISFVGKMTGRFARQFRWNGGIPTKGRQHCHAMDLQALCHQVWLQKQEPSVCPQRGTALTYKTHSISDIFLLTGQIRAWPWDGTTGTGLCGIMHQLMLAFNVSSKGQEGWPGTWDTRAGKGEMLDLCH